MTRRVCNRSARRFFAGAIASQHSLDTARETERQLRALGYISGTTPEAR